MNPKSFSRNQLFALFTMILIAIWGITATWLPISRPLGINYTEIQFLSALVPVFIILVPLYILRIRWSYLNGTLVQVGLWIGFIKAVLDHSYFFSFSFYNLITVLILIFALLGIYFSIRSFLELPARNPVQSGIGIFILLALSAAAVVLVSRDQQKVDNFVLRRVVQGVQSRTGDIADIEPKIEALMAEGKIPSLNAAVIVDDQVTWSKSYGVEPEEDKLYDIGSVTKTITATAVMQLYEKGHFGLDDDINQYLPFNVRHPAYPDTPITIRMLLANRSCLAHNTTNYYAYSMGPSLRDWGEKYRGWEAPSGIENMSYPEFMASYLEPGGQFYQPEHWANCQPGTEFVYSTPGFDLLAYLVEQVSGQGFPAYLEENLFKPLEMTSTTTTPLDSPEKIAQPYERWFGVLSKTNVEIPKSQRRIIGGGGLYSTVSDLANFLIMHLNDGSYNGTQLLTPESIMIMHSQASETQDDFLQEGYGFGWAIFQEESRQMWDLTFNPRGYQGHGGRTWGYSSVMAMVDQGDGGYGFVMLVNTSMTESIDQPWFFTTQYHIQDRFLAEANRLYQQSH